MDAKDPKVDFVFYGGLLVIPILCFVYIAIATNLSADGKCQQGLKSWLITDCIVFAWMVPDYFA